MESNSNLLKLLIKLRKGFPKNQLVYFLVLFMKILPVFILTHDWNINYGKGISFVLSYFTLGQLIFSLNSNLFTGVIVLIIGIITIIQILLFKISFLHFKKYGKIYPKARKYLMCSAGILFYLHFFLSKV